MEQILTPVSNDSNLTTSGKFKVLVDETRMKKIDGDKLHSMDNIMKKSIQFWSPSS